MAHGHMHALLLASISAWDVAMGYPTKVYLRLIDIPRFDFTIQLTAMPTVSGSTGNGFLSTDFFLLNIFLSLSFFSFFFNFLLS